MINAAATRAMQNSFVDRSAARSDARANARAGASARLRLHARLVRCSRSDDAPSIHVAVNEAEVARMSTTDAWVFEIDLCNAIPLGIGHVVRFSSMTRSWTRKITELTIVRVDAVKELNPARPSRSFSSLLCCGNPRRWVE